MRDISRSETRLLDEVQLLNAELFEFGTAVVDLGFCTYVEVAVGL